MSKHFVALQSGEHFAILHNLGEFGIEFKDLLHGFEHEKRYELDELGADDLCKYIKQVVTPKNYPNQVKPGADVYVFEAQTATGETMTFDEAKEDFLNYLYVSRRASILDKDKHEIRYRAMRAIEISNLQHQNEVFKGGMTLDLVRHALNYMDENNGKQARECLERIVTMYESELKESDVAG